MTIAISAAAGVLVFCIIVITSRSKAENYDMVRKRVNGIDRTVKGRYSAAADELSRPLSERIIKPALISARAFFIKFLPVINKRRKTENQKIQQLRAQLSMAGIAMGAEEFSAVRFLVITGVGFIFVFVAFIFDFSSFNNRILFSIVGFLLPYAVFRFFLTMRISKRKNEIENQLPDFLDLLSVSVEAGLGFEQAMVYISNNMEGPLIDEIIVTVREMTLGRTRKDALTLLGDRCDTDDIRSFVSAIIQAGQLGIPMKNVLRSQSASIRLSRKNKVQEKATKVSTKMLIPMVVFIFPVIFIVLMGPAVLNLLENL